MNSGDKNSAHPNILPAPHEPVMIRFVSEATGHTYDPEMVDHLADMLLIFYAGAEQLLAQSLARVLQLLSSCR